MPPGMRARPEAGRTPAEPGHPAPPVHASHAEPGPDLLPAHPPFRRRRTLVPVGVDASQELPLRLSYRWRMSPSALAASTARIAAGVQAGRGRTRGCLASGAVISSPPAARRSAQHKRVRRQTAATSRSRHASLWVTPWGPAAQYVDRPTDRPVPPFARV